ncbi:MAG: hypothetical protein NTV68_15420, partial [Methanomicrobiales archaeon]|nr:hypothetical protein [Methanomicrobiales archaeon]
MADSDRNQETKRPRPRSGTARNMKKPKREQETVGLKGDDITVNTNEMELLLQNAFNGDSDAQDEIRTQFINVNNFLGEAVPVLTRMAANDHTMKIEGHYEGLAADAAVGVNLVRERVLHVTGSVIKIGEGDLSEYEEYKEVGRRSENDKLVPAFVQCLGALNNLQGDLGGTTQTLKTGDIEARCTAKNLQGVYQELAQGVNEALDTVIAPV